MEDQNLDILERIQSAYYHLTASERKVADYVLSRGQQVQFMSITQLADECGTAEATVSRFCRTLKLQGFNAFKIELAKHAAASAHNDRQDHPDGSFESRKAQVASLSADAIRQTLDLLSQEKVSQAVRILEQAPGVLCIGSGGSMIMASECAHLFSIATGKFFALSDSHQQLTLASTMDPSHAIVLFSYSGATTAGLQVLELAKRRGIPTILVTRFSKSPAAKLATVCLSCGSNEGPFQFGSVPARVAQLMVIDVLFQEYLHRNMESCHESIRQVADALSAEHV